MVSAPQRREAAVFLGQRGVSRRRSGALVNISGSSLHYTPRPQHDDGWLRERLLELAHARRCRGYRGAWAALRREGLRINLKRVHRLWKLLGLGLANKRKRRRGAKGQVPLAARYPGQVWTYDFVCDATADGRRLRCLTLMDEFTRQCIAIEVDRRLPATRVIEVLARAMEEHGAPEYLRSDNGPEFIATVLRRWLFERGVATHYIEPGSPWQNAYGESFNDKFRRECLNMDVFHTLAESQVLIELWRVEYNQERPHMSLGYLTPAEFADKWSRRDATPVGALPMTRASLSLLGLRDEEQKEEAGLAPCPSLQSPATALGSLSSGALSSAQANQRSTNQENQLP
jgi:putative transposase